MIDNNRKNRVINVLKWARLSIAIIGLVLMSVSLYQRYNGIELIIPTYKIGSIIIGVFSVLLGLESVLKSKESFVNKFLVLYGVIMIFITFLY